MRITFSAIRKNVKPIATAALVAELRRFTQAFADKVVETVKKYPPEPAGSTYVRTYRLYNSWIVKDLSEQSGVRYAIYNPANDKYGRFYASLVHGPAAQRALHRAHGWLNIGDVVAQLGGRDTFRKGAQDIIDKHANTFSAAASASAGAATSA